MQTSLKKTKAGNYQIDASKYLDALGEKIDTIKVEQTEHNTNLVNKNFIDYGSSDANVLADFGIITKQTNLVDYRLENNVLRQEVIGMAMKLT